MNSNAQTRDKKLDDILRDAPIIPVLTIARADQAVPLARALVAGGLRAVEITLRTPAAPDAAAAIVRDVPEAIAGLGTVTTPRDLETAKALGAQFALSPGATPDLLEAAAAGEMPFMPGIQTASELMACVARGFNVVKFFPAVPAGGMAALKALAAPFRGVRFCPTGGLSEENFAAWLLLKEVPACGGSWMVRPADLHEGRWDAITARARRAVELLAEARREHAKRMAS